MSVILSHFEYLTKKMFNLLIRVWVSILGESKSAKKYYHIGTLEIFYLWSLAPSVKAESSTSCFPPIKLLDFLHVSTDRHNVKTHLVLDGMLLGNGKQVQY